MKLILKKILFYFTHFIILLINKIPLFKNFKLFEIDSTRVGHMVLETEIFYKESEESIIYFIFFERVSNVYFLKLFLEKINKKRTIIVLPFGFVWKKVCDNYYLFTKKSMQTKIMTDGLDGLANVRKKFNYLNDNIPFLSIPEKDSKEGYKILKKFGMKENDKWICVYNRDEAYLKKYYKNFDATYHNYRNFPVKDLEKAINLFIKKEYFVIRVGSESIGKLNINSHRYFDYSKSNIKSDFMDCFLLSKCEMFFGGASGICNLPVSFRRPYFLVNVTPLESIFGIKRIYPVIFKRLADMKTNKVLTISKMIRRDVCNLKKEELFRLKNVRNIDNTEDEIEEFAIESLNIFENKNIKKSETQILKQNLFELEVRKDPLIKHLEYHNPIGLKFLEQTLIN